VVVVVTNASKLIYLQLEEIYKTKSLLLYNKEKIDIKSSISTYLKTLKVPYLHVWLLLVIDYVTVVTYTGGVASTEIVQGDWKEVFNYSGIKKCLACENIDLDLLLTNLNIPND